MWVGARQKAYHARLGGRRRLPAGQAEYLGHADLLLGEACDKLRAAGHGVLGDRLEFELVGSPATGGPDMRVGRRLAVSLLRR